MSVLDDGFEAASHPPNTGGAGCAVGKWFTAFNDKDRARIRAVFNAPVQERSHPSVADAINARGAAVSVKQVQNHRAGRCQCDRVGWV